MHLSYWVESVGGGQAAQPLIHFQLWYQLSVEFSIINCECLGFL